MKSVLRIALLSVITLAVVPLTASAQNASDKQQRELANVNRQYDEALVRGDTAALAGIFADEFTYTSTSGEVLNKLQQLEVIRSGVLKIDKGMSENVELRIYGNFALVFGYFKAEGKFKGQAFNSVERYTSVWTRRTGRWQLIAEQGTLVSQSEKR